MAEPTTRHSSPGSASSKDGRSSSSAIRRARPQGAHEAELRDGVPRGLPQGDAGDGARRPARVSRRDDGRHPGAYPGWQPSNTARGAIARSQAAMVRLSVPTVACVIGEGGSGRRRSDRRGRPRADAGERDLLRHLARGLRGHSLARRGRPARPPPRSSRTRRTVSSSASSTRSCPSPKVRTRIPTAPRCCSERRSGQRSTRSKGSIPSNGAGSVVRSTASWASWPRLGPGPAFHRFHRLIPWLESGSEQGKRRICVQLVKKPLRFRRQSTRP